jgi:hypothetical protein
METEHQIHGEDDHEYEIDLIRKLDKEFNILNADQFKVSNDL